MSRSKSKKQNTPDVDELAIKLRALIGPNADEIPEGFLAVNEWVKRIGCDQSKVYGILKAGVASGLLEVSKFRVEQGKAAVKHWREV